MSHRLPAIWECFLYGLWCCAPVGLLMLMGGCATLDPDENIQPQIDVFGDDNDPDLTEEQRESDNIGLGSFDLEDLSPSSIAKKFKRMTGRGPNKGLAKQLYGQAEQEYKLAAEMPEGRERASRFISAGSKFAKAADYFPGSSVEMDALFMAAESNFFADHYWDATKFYERLIKAHPNNRYLDTVDARRFAIARYWLQLQDEHPEPVYYANFINETRPWRDVRGHALRQFDKIRLDDPTGRLADDATLAVANAHFKSRRYLKADEFYTDLRKTYPNSEHQFSAHYLGLKAKLESYLGPDYSGEALDEGEKLVKQMRRQFPDDAEKEREFLDRAAAEIRFKKAEKLHYFARYHDKRGEYRAAARRYQQIATDFGDTPFAEKSQQRLAQIQGLPPVPPQKLPWLVNLFPQSDKVKPILQAARIPEGELPNLNDEGRVRQASAEEPSP